MRAALLTVGDELLIGQVLDTNARWIAQYLNEHGLALVQKSTVGDRFPDIERGLRQADDSGAEVILLTGGLGPTADDLTAEALARHVGEDYVFNPDTYERIRYLFEEVIKRPLKASHRAQAFNPRGSTTLENKQGTAPGLWHERGGRIYVAMPGVPREMRYLMEHEVVPKLLARFPPAPRRQLTLHTSGWGETQIEEAIQELVSSLPGNLSVAYLPGLGTVRVRLSAEGAAVPELDASLREYAEWLERLLPAGLVFGRGETSLVQTVHARLRENGLRLATAESCTGGQVGHLVTQLPGASAVYTGGVIAYDNGVKERQLHVAPETLAAHGAVSEPAVVEMVAGVLDLLGADVAIATTGVAGPGGGTPTKPVGTVWIAAGDRERVVTRLLSLGRDRETNIAYSANAALDLLRRFLFGFEPGAR